MIPAALLFLSAFSELPPLESEFQEWSEFDEIPVQRPKEDKSKPEEKTVEVEVLVEELPVEEAEEDALSVEESSAEEEPTLEEEAPAEESFLEEPLAEEVPAEEPPVEEEASEDGPRMPPQENHEALVSYVKAPPFPPCSSCVEPSIREISLYERFVKEGICVIDFGAKNGMRSLVFSELVGEKGRVVAFESRPELFKEMYWNLKAAKAKNVELYCVPFWEKEQHLDAFYFEDIALMRIDANGREDIFLKGAIGTILKCRPVLIVNLLGGIPIGKMDLYVQKELDKRLDLLHKMGYTTQHLEKSLYLALPKGYSLDKD